MEIQPDFFQFYSRLSNPELVDILDNPGTYHAEALAAAKKEI